MAGVARAGQLTKAKAVDAIQAALHMSGLARDQHSKMIPHATAFGQGFI
jgi:hypothetical protein